MSLVTLEVDIENGTMRAREPHLVPQRGVGLLTVLPAEITSKSRGERLDLPLIRCETGSEINPSRQELDGSLWD